MLFRSGKLSAENIAMQTAATIFQNHHRYEAAQRLARVGQTIFKRDDQLTNLPGMAGGWTRSRDLRPIPKQSFRDWWKTRPSQKGKEPQ